MIIISTHNGSTGQQFIFRLHRTSWFHRISWHKTIDHHQWTGRERIEWIPNGILPTTFLLHDWTCNGKIENMVWLHDDQIWTRYKCNGNAKGMTHCFHCRLFNQNDFSNMMVIIICLSRGIAYLVRNPFCRKDANRKRILVLVAMLTEELSIDETPYRYPIPTVHQWHRHTWNEWLSCGDRRRNRKGRGSTFASERVRRSTFIIKNQNPVQWLS